MEFAEEIGGAALLLGHPVYEKARRRMEPFSEKTTFLRMTSMDALPQFKANELDFIYLDARHDYCAAIQDLRGAKRYLLLYGAQNRRLVA